MFSTGITNGGRNRIVAIFLAAVGQVVFGFISRAETSDSSAGFSVRSWNARDGLPASEINALVRTPDGFLWAGTAAGLVRFDGDRFVLLTTNATPALGDNHINALLVDQAGDLWVGTQGGTLARRHEGKFLLMPLPPPLGGGKITSLAEDRDRGVWVLSPSGVGRMAVTNCEMIQTANGPLNHPVTTGLTDETGRLWGLAPTYLDTYADGHWQEQASSFESAALLAMSFGREHEIWLGVSCDVIGAKAGQVLCLKGGKLAVALAPYPWPMDSLRTSVQAICEDRRGRVWAGTAGSGVFYWSPAQGWRRLVSEGLPANAVVTCIHEDADGFLWIATQRGGLHQVSEPALTTLALPDAGAENVVQTVCASRTGSLWVGTDGGGVFRRRTGDDAFEAVTNGLASRYIRTLFEDSHTNLWVGTRRGLQRWTGTEFAAGNTYAPFNWLTFSMGEDGGDALWFAGSGGLVRMQSEHAFQIFKRDAGLARYLIRGMARDPAGRLYLAAPGYGLLVQDGARFQALGKDRWAGAEKIVSLYADAAGALWITTEGAGLFRFKDKQFRQWTMADGLPDNSLAGVTGDAAGNLWISMSSGIFRCAKSQLETYERGATPPVLCWQLPLTDTAPATADNGPWQPQPACLPDGRLCFANQGRLLLFDPARLAGGAPASLPAVEESFVDGVARSVDAGGWLRVKSGARQFEFHYTAPDLAGPGRLHFRYRLDGMDSSWVDADLRRVAYYNYLPPGDYELRLMAGGADGVWRESPRRLKLEIVPRFWERRPLQLAGTALLLLAVAGSVRQVERMRARRKIQALQTQQALEQERRRIAQDLHDDIGASVSQLMMLGEMANRASATPETTRQNVTRIQEKTRDLARAMDETIWAVNPRNDTLANLISYTQVFATEFFEGSPIRFRLDAPTDLPDVPLEVTVRHNIFLAMKEAMSNVAKHSGAKEVWLRARWNGAELEVLIEDDGCGFAPGPAGAEQDGLGNMPARLRQVGGTCEVQSHPGAGCCVRFTVPLSPAPKNISPVSGMEKDPGHHHGGGI